MAEYHVGCGAFAIYAGTQDPMEDPQILAAIAELEK